MVNVAVPPSAFCMELSEGSAEFAVCSHYFHALSVLIPVYRQLSLKDTCTPILVKNHIHVNSALSDVLKAVL